MAKESNLAVWAAFFANVAIAVTKFIAAALSGSSAMFSEAIHSLVDSTNELFLLWGQHRAHRPADEAHPFGHGHELYFWTLIVAINVFGVGGGVSIYEGLQHLSPHPLEGAGVSYLVLGIALAFEALSWTIGYRRLHRNAQARSVWRQMRETKDPRLTAVVLEDSAALVGIALAFLGVSLSHALHAPWIDGAASIAIGCVLAVVALLLAREAKGLLLGESASRPQREEIARLTAADGSVAKVVRALTLQLGPKEILLNMDVRFRRGLSAEEVTQAIERLERTLQARFPEIRHIFIESQALRAR